jgi:hypothetical protein
VRSTMGSGDTHDDGRAQQPVFRPEKMQLVVSARAYERQRTTVSQMDTAKEDGKRKEEVLGAVGTGEETWGCDAT